MRSAAWSSKHCPEKRLALRLAPWLICAATGVFAAPPACEPWVEAHPAEHGIHLRTHRDAFLDCTLDEPGYHTLVQAWLSDRGDAVPALQWVFLGRIVDYPWLSRELAGAALADPGWDALAGRPRGVQINAYVAALLSRPALLDRLGQPFEGQGMAVRAVSVEKVLVTRARELEPSAPQPDARLPYDAQAWLQLRPLP